MSKDTLHKRGFEVGTLEYLTVDEAIEKLRSINQSSHVRIAIDDDSDLHRKVSEDNTQKLKWSDHSSCGMWKDREDMQDVDSYVRNIRKTRYENIIK